MRLLALLVLAGASALPAFSQIWVEDYQFNGTGLDSAKWNSVYSNAILPTFNGSYMNLQYRGEYQISWYNPVPLDKSWTAVIRMRSNRVASLNWPVYSQIWFYGGIENLFRENPEGADIWGAVVPYNSFLWFGISNDANTKTTSRVFSLNPSSEIPSINEFIQIGDQASTADREDTSVNLNFWWSMTGPSSFDTSDFKIVPYSVPEPSSLSLLLAGGAVLMAGRRRKV